MLNQREKCPYQLGKPRMVCRHSGLCCFQDAGFIKQIELYCYMARLSGQQIGEIPRASSVPNQKKSQKIDILAEVYHWFSDGSLLEDYHKGRFMTTGKLPLNARKCRIWRRAYRKYRKWKAERDLERIQRYLEAVMPSEGK
jgi:hypothetical protein